MEELHPAWTGPYICSWVSSKTHLPLRDTDGIPEYNPSDTLTEGGRGQRAWIGPVVPAGRQEALGVEAAELGLGSLGQGGDLGVSTDLLLSPGL